MNLTHSEKHSKTGQIYGLSCFVSERDGSGEYSHRRAEKDYNDDSRKRVTFPLKKTRRKP